MKAGHKVLASHTILMLAMQPERLVKRITACVCAVRTRAMRVRQHLSRNHIPTGMLHGARLQPKHMRAPYVNHRHLLLHYLTMRRSAPVRAGASALISPPRCTTVKFCSPCTMHAPAAPYCTQTSNTCCLAPMLCCSASLSPRQSMRRAARAPCIHLAPA